MSHAITAVQRALAARLREEADELGRILPTAIAGDVRGVHRARVASRRLSEALPIAAAAAAEDVETLRRQLRRVRRALGPVREIDVARGVLAHEALDREWSAALVDRLDARCVARRDAARETVRRKLSRRIAEGLAKRIRAVAAALEHSAPSARAEALLASRLRTRARGFARTLTATGTLYAPEALHAVRIAAKKLRYTLELGREVARLPASSSVRELKAVQDMLGELRDLQGLQSQIAAAAADRDTDQAAMRTLEAWKVELDADCRARHAAFVRIMPELEQLASPLATELPLRLVRPRPRRISGVMPAAAVRLRREAGRR